jgi:SHS2 domain-containing protein
VSATDRGHRALPHTADVIIEAWGPDLPACCEEAVAGLVETYADLGPGPGPADAAEDAAALATSHRHVHLAAAPADALLFDVLEEVIFTLDTDERVPVSAVVERVSDGGLEVVLLLAERSRLGTTGSVPKAVSRSEYGVSEDPGAVRCRFLVDV